MATLQGQYKAAIKHGLLDQSVTEEQFAGILGDPKQRKAYYDNSNQIKQGAYGTYDSFSKAADEILAAYRQPQAPATAEPVATPTQVPTMPVGAAADSTDAAVAMLMDSNRKQQEQDKKERARINNAQLPMSDEDNQREERIRMIDNTLKQVGVERFANRQPIGDARENVLQQQQQLEQERTALQGQRKSYMNEPETIEEARENWTTAWMENTEEGKQAKREADEGYQQAVDYLRNEFAKSKTHQDIVADVQRKYNSGALTYDEANAELNKRLNDAFIAENKETLEAEYKTLYGGLAERAYKADNGWLKKQEERIGTIAVQEAIDEGVDELNEAMRADYEAFSKTVGNGFGAAQAKSNYINTQQAGILGAASQLYQETETILESTVKGEEKFGTLTSEILRHSKDKLANLASFGMSDVNYSAYQAEVLKKIANAGAYDNPESVLDRNEQVLYNAIVSNVAAQLLRAENTSHLANAGKLTADMLPFVRDIIMGKGLLGGFSAAAEKGLMRGIVRSIGTGKWGKLLANLGKTGVGLVESTAISLISPSTYQQVFKEEAQIDPTSLHLTDEGWKVDKIDTKHAIDAFAAAHVGMTKELFTETGGMTQFAIRLAQASPLGKYLRKTKIGQIAQMFDNTIAGKLFNQTAYHGFAAELSEEWENTFYDAVFAAMNKDNAGKRMEAFGKVYGEFVKPETQVPMLISFALPAIFGGAVSTGQIITINSQYKQAYENLRNTYMKYGATEEDFEDALNELRAARMNMNIEDYPQLINGLAATLSGGSQEQADEFAAALSAYTVADANLGAIQEKHAKKQRQVQQLIRDIQASEERITSNTHTDSGMMYHVNVNGQPGYVVSGALELNTYDNADLPIAMNSDVVTVRMEDGSVKQIAANQLQLLEQPQAAEGTMAFERRRLTARMNNLDRFKVGDVIYMTDNGQPIDGNSSRVVDVTDEGVVAEIIDPNGQPNTTVIPHEVAESGLSTSDELVEEGVESVVLEMNNGSLITMQKTTSGDWMQVAPKDDSMTLLSQEDLDRFIADGGAKIVNGEQTPSLDVASGNGVVSEDTGNNLSRTAQAIVAARNGDQEAQEKLSQYGIKWGHAGVYRYVGESEVEYLRNDANAKVMGKFDNGRVDVTGNGVSPTSATNADYQIEFKPSQDLYMGEELEGNRTRMKNEETEDGWLEGGYTLSDVAKIKKRNADGTYTVIYDAEQGGWIDETTPSKYPTTQEGKLDWGQMDVPTATEAAIEKFGDKNTAKEYAELQIAQAKKAVAAANKKKATSTDADEFVAQKNAIRQEQQAAQAELSKWENVLLGIANYKTAEEQAAAEQAAAQAAAVRAQRKQTIEGVGGTNMAERLAASPRIDGNAGSITAADGTKIPGHYVLVSANALTPSHNPNANFAPSEGYPTVDGQSINDRDYQADQEEQAKVQQVAQTYDGRAITNMPIVSDEGLVYSGNGRTMAGQLAAANGTDGAYKEALLENAKQYGFTAEQVESVPNARVVFMTDERLPYNTTTLALFNQTEQQTQSNTASAAANVRKLTPEAVGHIIAAVQEFDTVDAFFGDSRAPFKLVNRLIADGIISERDKAAFVDNGRLTNTGKDRLTALLFGTAFDEKTIRLLGDNAKVRNSVMRALPQILENKGLGDFSLFEHINNAIAAIYDMDTNGMSFFEFTRQIDIEGKTASDKYTAFELLLVDEMVNGGVQAFRDVLSGYNARAKESAGGQLDMFTGEVLTTEELTKQILQEYEQRKANERGGAQPESAVAGTSESDGEKIGTTQEKTQKSVEEQQKSGKTDFSPEEKLAAAEAETDTNPTEAQKKAENYKQGHVTLWGLPFTIENPKGSVRRGTDANGKQWEQVMNNTYGKIRRTEGVDGDHIDVFFGPNLQSDKVFVVDQLNVDTKEFDEHKVMLGFDSMEEAQAAYLSNYEKGWQGMGPVTETTMDEFKKWINSSHRKTKPFNEYKSVKQEGASSGVTNRETTERTPREEPAMRIAKAEAKMQEFASKLGAQGVHLISDKEQLPKEEGAAYRAIRNGANVMGWYNPKTNQVYIYLPNANNLQEVYKTLLHEFVAHKGLRDMLGKEKFDQLCHDVWDMMSEQDKLQYALYVKNNTAVGSKAMQEQMDSMTEEEKVALLSDIKLQLAAADEYMAHFAETGVSEQERSIWQRIVDAVRDLLRKAGINLRLTDADIARLLYESSSRLSSDMTMRERSQLIAKNNKVVENIGNLDLKARLNDDVMFKLGTQVADIGNNTLVGLHNLSATKLRKAIKQGGLANPSAAVIDIAKQDHEQYGEISLVMPSSLVDSATGQNAGTYTGDIWSPTYPYIERKMNSKGTDKYYETINKVFENAPVGIKNRIQVIFVNMLDNQGDPDNLAYWYMLEKGITPTDVIINSGISDDIKQRFEPLRDKHFVSDMNAEERGLLLSLAAELEGKTTEDLLQAAQEAKARYEAVLANEKASGFSKRIATEAIDEIDTYGVRFNLLGETFRKINEAIDKDGGVDVNASIGAAVNYVQENGLKDDFDSWLDNLDNRFGIEEVIFDGYNRNGDRKYIKHTLENASRIMNQQPIQNASSHGGLSATRGQLVERMSTLAQIRANKHRLAVINEYEDEQWKAMQDEWFNKIINPLSNMQQIDSNHFINMDIAEQRLLEAIMKKDPIAHLNREYGYSIAKDSEFAKSLKDLMQRLKELPSKYFETKFKRPVYLNEFVSAVVPQNLSQDLKDGLANAGVELYEYDEEQDGSRREATLQATESDDVRFSIKNNEDNLHNSKKNSTFASRFQLGRSVIDIEDEWSKIAIESQRESMPKTALWHEGIGDVIIHTNLPAIKAKYSELHAKAKAGDVVAARELVRAVVKRERVKELAERFPNAIVAFPHAEEASGKNKIPAAYAAAFATEGLEVAEDIIQSVKPHHTGSDKISRFVRRARYDGEVVSGRKYIIVDDHVTMGGTLRDLKDYIESKGGRVVAVSTITASAGGTKLVPDAEQINALQQAGITNEQLKNLGIADNVYGITKSEARELLVLSNKRGAGRTPQRSSRYYGVVQTKPNLGLTHNSEQISSSEVATNEDAARFRISNDRQRIFVSNAEKAVEGIKQEKATPQQWLAMLEKNGGVKAGEDKWLGLSEWLKEQDKKSITKQEILDFISENQIQIEEVEYEEYDMQSVFEGYRREYKQYYDEAVADNAEDPQEDAWQRMIEEHGEDFSMGFYAYGDELQWDADSNYVKWELENSSESGSQPINDTRMQYTTDGLDAKREIALTVPTIESWNEGDEVHFGDAGGGRAVAWVRFGETINEDGRKVLVIDEIQSKRHQEGREKGYKGSFDNAALEQAQKESTEYSDYLYEKYIKGKRKGEDFLDYATEEEKAKFRELSDKVAEINKLRYQGIPDAPFDKNWHELAMKRMLRYAAENGYDYVAWTTGAQQAERYDIGSEINVIDAFRDEIDDDIMDVNVYTTKQSRIRLDVSRTTGKVVNVANMYKEFMDKPLAELIGKDLANDIIKSEYNQHTYEGDGLRIGGEGMKGFYDRMLPSFVSKYTKKWGAKVQDINLPNLEESAQTMHAVNVTESMKEDVMAGQPMFRITEEENRTPFTEAQQLIFDGLRDVAADAGIDIVEVSEEEALEAITNLTDEVEPSIRTKPAPKKTGIGYKVFYRGKDGKLYPPMVANPNGADTPIGVWLDADAAPIAGESKTGRQQVKAGGKGTQGGSGTLAFRPGWHLGEIPYALQFNRKDETGERTLFPKDFVWAEVEYAKDVDYQAEAESYGYTENGKYRHSYAGLPRVPENGSYRYRTNPNPQTDPWIITGAMKVNRVLTKEEVDDIVRKAGREPQPVELLVNPINGKILGYAQGGTIYLTKTGMTPETMVHEYTHVWAKAMQRNNRAGWENIKDIFKKSPLWDHVKNDPNYKDRLTTDDAICSEVLARFSGKQGAERLNEVASEFINEEREKGGSLGAARVRQFINHARQAIKSFWKWVDKNLFGITKFDSMEDVADRVLYDLLNATELDVDRSDNTIESSIEMPSAEFRAAMKAWNDANPYPIYMEGESLGAFSDRLTAWKEARDAYRAELWRKSQEKIESADPITEPTVAGSKPVRRKDETSREYAQRLKQWQNAQIDSQLSEEYTAEMNRLAGTLEKAKRAFVDAALPIEEWQKWLIEHGATMTSESNAYQDMFLAQGRVSNAAEELRRDIIQKLTRKIAAIIESKKLDDVDLRWQNMDVPGTKRTINGNKLSVRELIGVYCQAKDCEEAEEKGLPDRGKAGFKNNLDVEYTDIVNAVETRLSREDITELWYLINRATKYALDYDLFSGRISPDTYNEFVNRDYYVPQRGWRERDESGLIEEYEPVGKRGHDPYNAALVKARGRQSLAADPFAYIMSIDHSSIVSSENNKIKQKMLQFCLDNEEIGLKTGAFRVKKYWLMHEIDPDTGKIRKDEDGAPITLMSYTEPKAEDFKHDKKVKDEVKRIEKEIAKRKKALEKELAEHGDTNYAKALQRAIANSEAKIEDLNDTLIISFGATNTHISQRTRDEKLQHEVQVMKDGQRYVIELQDEKVANAINKKFKQHQEALFNVSDKMRNATRFMSAMLTQYNPEFAASNFVRDFQVAVMTLTNENPKLLPAFLKNFAACQRAVMAYAFADKVQDRTKYVDSDMGRLLEEYMKSGAPTGFSYMQDLKTLRKDFDNMVNEGKLSRGVRSAAGIFSMLTEISETSVRFAAYAAARQAGWAINDAAYMSKELTTNFDRAGEMADSGWMSWFSFMRATINGNVKFFRAFKKLPVAYSITAAVYFAMGIINQFANPNDPEDEVWASDYTRETNFIIGKWRIPAAHFMRIFYSAGVNLASWMQGERTFGHAVYNSSMSAFNEILPNYMNVPGAFTEWSDEMERVTAKDPKAVIRELAPTPISPFVDVWANRNFMGGTINREPFVKTQENTKDILMAKDKALDNALLPYRAITELVYTTIGGDLNSKYKSDDNAWTALFDVSGSSLEHIVEGYFTGSAEMLIVTGYMIYNAVQGNELTPDKITFIRKFYNRYTPQRAYDQQYWLLKGRVQEYERKLNDYEDNNPDKYELEMRSKQYKAYEETNELIWEKIESPTTEDVKRLMEANQQWIKARK